MMMCKNSFIVFTFVLSCTSLINSFNIFSSNSNNRWIGGSHSKSSSNDIRTTTTPIRTRKFFTSMTTMMTDVAPESVDEKVSSKIDFSTYAIGQEYQGKAIAAKQFGIFVDISTGTNVLIPRSLLSKNNYDKLKALVDTKSVESVKLELIGISAENQTLSAKYIPLTLKTRKDLSSLEGKDFTGKYFQATIISGHDFGLFAEVDELGVEGLIPTSKLPDKLPAATAKLSYPPGTSVQVQIEEVNIPDKKLTLSMKSARADVSAFSDIEPTRWMQGTVQSVSNFGMFVRPAGYDASGLVHNTRIPRDLISALKRRAPITPGQNKTDVELLFSEGDVVKIRVQAVKVDARRVELSMLPYRASDSEEDDYIVEGRDPEGEENKFEDTNNDEIEEEKFDGQDTLLWWKGQPYQKETFTALEQEFDEDTEVLNESKNLVEGTWRRMFELDMREDAADFSSKVVEKDLEELAEEIGELDGLDLDLIEPDRFGVKDPTQKARFGSFVSLKSLPIEWKEDMDFFKQLEISESEITSKLRGGKAADQAEFESLLKEVELELEQAASRVSSRRSANADVVSMGGDDEATSSSSVVIAQDEVAVESSLQVETESVSNEIDASVKSDNE